jgi:hypothetical protein
VKNRKKKEVKNRNKKQKRKTEPLVNTAGNRPLDSRLLSTVPRDGACRRLGTTPRTLNEPPPPKIYRV